jgi:hypothetical protein
MVRDRRYDDNTANTTAIAKGRKSEAAGPLSRKIGMNTIEIESDATNVGVAI